MTVHKAMKQGYGTGRVRAAQVKLKFQLRAHIRCVAPERNGLPAKRCQHEKQKGKARHHEIKGAADDTDSVLRIPHCELDS